MRIFLYSFVTTAMCIFQVAASSLPVHGNVLDRRLSTTSLLPSQDPFYNTPPADFGQALPGKILRARNTTISSTFNASSAVYQLLFRTTNSLGQPLWALNTLFVPKTLNTTHPGLLSYQVPYNTADVDSSISVLLHANASNLGIIFTDIQRALENGFYVTVPDHEGPQATYSAGLLYGQVTLDNVRASLEYIKNPATRYVLWGYSGGSLASGMAAELQSTYAPDLRFAGIAIGGFGKNLSEVLVYLDGSPGAPLIPGSFIGILSQYQDGYNLLLRYLKKSGPYNATGFLGARNHSAAPELIASWVGQAVIEDYFDNGREFLQDPVVKSVFEKETVLGTGGFWKMPIYGYKSINDEFIPISGANQLINEFCDAGANILYEINMLGNHQDEEVNGDSSAWRFLESALAGEEVFASRYSTHGCTFRNVTITTSVNPPFMPGLVGLA